MMKRVIPPLLALAVLAGACATDNAGSATTGTTGTGATGKAVEDHLDERESATTGTTGTGATGKAVEDHLDERESATTGTTGTGATVSGGPTGLFASELVEFDSCEAFLDRMKSEALERVGPYGFDDGRSIMVDDWVEEDAMEAAAAPLAEDAPTAGVDYSTTNVQELGVDEPDIVKTDGHRILALAYGALHYVDVSSEIPELVSSLPLTSWKDRELWNHQMFVSGDTALLMAADYSDVGVPTTIAAQIDLSRPEDLQVVGALVVDGSFVSARLVGDRVALVVSSEPRIRFEFVYPATTSRSAESRAERTNRMVIEESTLEHWAPRYELRADGASGRTDEGVLIDCSTAYAPQEFSGMGLLSVLTFDITEDIDVPAVATVMSQGDTVYASTDRLYVASQRWIDWNAMDEEDVETITTDIHRFDLAGPEGPVYVASGSVDGFLLSQFAMSEHNGFLRVASTNAPAWRWWGDGGASESRVDVMEADGKELRVVGSVGGLGRGEQIYAVRFMGEIGYVVTFREIDPLYTIDLSDPTAPKVVGELKIPGYSAYLHPIGDGMLLGVGRGPDEEGRPWGTQVSIFDVSDLADPRRTHLFTLPGHFSDVEFDHRAFLFWPPTGMVALPVVWVEDNGVINPYSGDIISGVVVFRVGPDGIVELGRIAHEPESGAGDDCPYYAHYDLVSIRRSLVVDGTLFTLSVHGLEGFDLDTLSETASIPFPCAGGENRTLTY